MKRRPSAPGASRVSFVRLQAFLPGIVQITAHFLDVDFACSYKLFANFFKKCVDINVCASYNALVNRKSG